MGQQLISPETVKLAREKGFDFTNIEIRDSITLLVVNNVKERLLHFGNMKDSNLIQIPSQSLLQKWSREVHHLDISIIRTENEYFRSTYKAIISNVHYTLYESNILEVKDYEEALEEALFEALKLIKNETIQN